MSDTTLLVIAKEPVPGQVKTRLTPPLAATQAAALAEAALHDTLQAVADTPAKRRILVLDGNPGPWLPAGFEIVAQGDGDLGARLTAAFAAADHPALLVGMDTPQVTRPLLEDAVGTLSRPDVDAVIGSAVDGGYWAIGFSQPTPGAFDEVPMSRGDTGDAQRRRLDALGLRWAELAALRDVDEIDDARAVAQLAPDTRFARVVAELGAVG
ncbi:MAG: TIGR04282 family arsenosugar biosynthesis glycosyltransferase [Solirubrobacterales bacterium]